ncbi:MAG: hypothetical protein ACI8P7_001263 [Candidatus Azotimanducaceae bacterium]|jgi:hypothetical protein
MKRFALICTALLLANISFGQISEGQIGIGGDAGFASSSDFDDDNVRTVLFSPTVSFAVMDNILLDATIGIVFQKEESGNSDIITNQLTLGVGAKKLYYVSPKTAFFVGGVGSAGIVKVKTTWFQEEQKAEMGLVQLGINGGIYWFASEFFSIHTTVGLVTGSLLYNKDYDATQTQVEFGGIGNIFGNAGFTYWF